MSLIDSLPDGWAVLFILALGLPALVLVAMHLATLAIMVRRCRPRAALKAARLPAVTILRPVCGLEPFSRQTLTSAFRLAHDDFEVVFCVADAADPVLPLVREICAAHPGVPSRILVGDQRISINPKLNNLVKGWAQADHDWIVMADSNVMMPPDYLARLFHAWDRKTGWDREAGLVCAPPIGTEPSGFGALIEAGFLNTYQARWQYAADSLGFGFAQGKSMLWRRDILDAAGGMRALATEPAEDAAATKVVRRAGLSVRLCDAPFGQPLGERSLSDVWHRQVRWARLRRATFPPLYALEVASTGLLPIALAGVAAIIAGLPAWPVALAVALVWYGGEWLAARLCAWPAPVLALLAWPLRDLLVPAIWIEGWRSRGFTWRGNAMHVDAAAGSSR